VRAQADKDRPSGRQKRPVTTQRVLRVASSQPDIKITAKKHEPGSGIHPKPILASEALKEDYAPLEPGASWARMLTGVSALVFAGMAVGMAWSSWAKSVTSHIPAQTVSIAIVLAVIAAARLRYTVRAGLMILVGVMVSLASLFQYGPASGLVQWSGTHVPGEVARLVAATSLAAALFFRGHYRAFKGARHLLTFALLFSLPFVVRSSMVTIYSGHLAERIAAGVTIVSVLTALTGFMGKGTTALGTTWGVCVLVTLSGEILFRHGPVPTQLNDIFAALTMMVATSLVATGVFQIGAKRYATEARKVDWRYQTLPPE
jgi:hypothetical protein